MSCQILVTGSTATSYPLNADKTNFTLFDRVRQRNDIPVVLPTAKINNTFIKGVDHIKFLGVLFDENLT